MEMSSTADLTNDANPKTEPNPATTTNGNAEQEPASSSGWKTKSFCEKISYLRDVITVEPIVLLFVLSATISRVAIEILAIHKACRVNLNYPEEVCDAIIYLNSENYTEEVTNSVALVAQMNTWKSPLQSFIPLVLIFFLGSFSDRRKIRKPFLIFPIAGEMLSMVCLVLCVVYMNSWPMEAVGISEAIFPSVCGGASTFTMAFYAYIADVSSIEMRTLRIGIVHIFSAVSAPIGFLAAAFIFDSIGYYGVFSISIVLYGVAIIYGILKIKEPKKPVHVEKKNIVVDFFDPKNAIDTFKVLVKKREGSLRLQTLLLVFVFIATVGPDSGTSSIGFNYPKIKFNWALSDYNIWLASDVVIHLVGTTLAITLLSRTLGIADPLLAALSALTRICIDFIYAFAKFPYVMYIGSVVGFFVGVGNVAVRSMSTKIVAEDELGQMQSLFGIVEAVVPLVYNPLYNYVFSKTVSTFPGAFLLLGAAMLLPAIFIYIWIHILQQRATKKSKKHGEDNNLGEFRYTVPMSEM